MTDAQQPHDPAGPRQPTADPQGWTQPYGSQQFAQEQYGQDQFGQEQFGGADPFGSSTSNLDPGLHLNRVFFGGLRSVEPTEAERCRLAAAGVADPLTQRYAAWRRSLLMVTAPVVGFSGALAAVALVKDVETENLSGLGVMAQTVPYLAVILLSVVTIMALRSWERPRASAKVLGFGWGLSVALPLLVAFIPADAQLSNEMLAGAPDEELFLVRLILGFALVINLLPIIISVPGGLVRGAVRMKALLPASTLSGWVLVVIAPIYSLFFLVALNMVHQLLGSILLVAGIGLIAAAPIVHVVGQRLYWTPLTAEADLEDLASRQRVAGIVSVAGGAVLVVWALTAESLGVRIVGSGESDLIDPLTGLLRSIEIGVRVLITTAVFTHVMLEMTVAQWSSEREFASSPAAEWRDAELAQTQHTLQISTVRPPTQWPPSVPGSPPGAGAPGQPPPGAF